MHGPASFEAAAVLMMLELHHHPSVDAQLLTSYLEDGSATYPSFEDRSSGADVMLCQWHDNER